MAKTSFGTMRALELNSESFLPETGHWDSRRSTMAQEQTKICRTVHQGLDLCLTAVAFILAYFIKNHWLPADLAGVSTAPNYYFLLLLALVTFYMSFQFNELYAFCNRHQRFDKIFVRVIKAVSIGFALFILALYLIHQQDVSRIMMGLFAVFSIVFISLSKGIIYYAVAFHGKRELSHKKVLVIGSRDRAQEMVNAITNDPASGYDLLGCLDVDEKQMNVELAPGVRVIGMMDKFRDILLSKTVDEVVFALPLSQIEDARSYIGFAEELGVNVRIMPDWQLQRIMYNPEAARIYFDDFIGMPTIALTSTPANEAQLFFKSIIDYVGAAVVVVILSPLFVVISLLVKLSSPGPVIFGQERSGLNGRKFNMFKFRTMVCNADELQAGLCELNEVDGPVFKMKKDPRLTPIGKFLRKTSLDELPQLINVIRGEMSLVGPRPPIPSEVEQYKPWQRRRLSMKPGLTCIWQVSGRNNIDFERWMQLDLEYIDNWSILLDLKLLFLTIPAVLFGTGR